MTRPTPFPWHVTGENCGDGRNIADARGRELAWTAAVRSGLKPGARIEKAEAEANAKLIASLGDLVGALLYVEEGQGTSRSAKERIDAALRKAGLRP